MTRILMIPMFILPLLLPSPLQAQDREGSFALGVGLRPATIVTEDDLFGTLAPRFYFAFQPSESVLVEPSLALFRFSREVESEFGTSSFTTSVVRFGTGILFLGDGGADGRTYWGPRLGAARIASESETTGGPGSDSERWDLSLALVAGGEYFLVPALGLGGEVGLEYTRVGDDGTGGEQSGSLISTLAELRLRWYPR